MSDHEEANSPGAENTEAVQEARVEGANENNIPRMYSSATGYADAYDIYLALGWQGVLPLRRGTKFPPPSGYTGGGKPDPTHEQMADWARNSSYRDGGLCLRMPDDVVGIDVDAYGKKTGAETLAEAQRRWGELPPTVTTTSRADGVSGIRLFRVPAGVHLVGVIKFDELKIGDIEIIQRDHRYAVCWPSIHPETGMQYLWRGSDGLVMEMVPRPEDLPFLPAAWLEALMKAPRCAKPSTMGQEPSVDRSAAQSAEYVVDVELTDGQPSPKVSARLGRALYDLSLGISRHDATRDHVLALLRFGSDGEPGVLVALQTLGASFEDVVGQDRDGGGRQAAEEFERMVLGAGRFLYVQEPVEQVEMDPIPLTTAGPLPPFPVDALPGTVAAMVLAVAEATQTDPAMAAVSALAALSACTGGHAETEIRSGWREPLCLYSATIAHSGERKSAVQQAMVRPILEAETAMRDLGVLARLAAETQKQVAAGAAERLRREAARGGAGQEEMDEAIRAAQMAEAIEVPPVPRLVADDVTPEAAASLLAEQGGRLAIISAEGGIFDIIAGRYSTSKAANMDLWLKGHSGDPLRVDRKGRPPEHIPRPALTLGLMIQPSVLNAIAANSQFRGRGFLARILYAYPVSKVGRRLIGAPPVPPDVARVYEATVGELAAGMAGWIGDPAILTLTEDAHQAFLAIEEAVEPTLAGEGELAALADWGGKYAGMLARLAGILHLAEHGPADGPRRSISQQTVLAASRLGDYFKAAAINAHIEMGVDRVTADAIYLLGRIRHLGHDEVSERDMQRAAKRFQSRADLAPAVARLVEHGYLSRLPIQNPTGGRNASPRYTVTKATQGTEGTP